MDTVVGRYTLLRKLASGGMAEVFLARLDGIEGFEKLVVLKRILPHHSDNPDFVRMFLDEARTAADLSHPNVVNVYDAGLHEGTYFITMEYLRGRDLGAVLSTCAEKKKPLPLEVTLQLVIDAARGLHAAHTKRDLEGNALKIVHRDISPGNLFATWDGVTKVLDFGIAHAATHGADTEAGVVKGKISYLSPEQLEGFELDGRSDQFALGIVAWELLTLQRLFARPSDAEVLRAILEHRVPRPRSIAGDVPQEIEDVVLRMLAQDREARFATCADVADALEAFLDAQHLAHSPARVGRALRALFPDAQTGATRVERTEETKETVLGKAPPTRPDRKRQALQHEDDFLSAVSSFLQERPERRKSNLVPPAGAFVGREKDLGALKHHFDGGERLVTIVGFGGMGKTRLAQELAWRDREVWAKHGGAWFCDLADARSQEDVCKAVARALEVQVPLDAAHDDTVTSAGRTLKTLGRALIVLDNFEQVIGCAPRTVGHWVKQAPEACFLVTSREALRLPDEVVHPLAPLSTADGSSEAVELFLARAAQAGAQRPAAPSDLAAVAEICRKLEGHALAIELAAARLPQMRPRELLERIQERFALLGGRDELAGRHGTLWNAIDWSWQLLSASEQSAFAQLSVFRGGFTPESAVAVLDVPGVPDGDELDVVEALHRKSLLQHFVAPEAPMVLRLRMLESLQQFAAEKLEALALVAATRARHAVHYLERGGECLEALTTAASAEAMNELFAERENLGEVFERALGTLPPTKASARAALGALHVLEPVMLRKGPYASHLALLDESLRVAKDVGIDAGTRALGLQQRGNALRARGRLQQAVDDLVEALALARTTSDRRLQGRIECDLAVARFVTGANDPALEGLEAARGIARETGDTAWLVQALAFLAIVRVARHEPALATECCDEALPVARAQGDRLNEARLLGTMGSIFLDEGRLELAQAFLHEAVERCRAIQELRLQGYFLGKLGHILAARGDRSAARRRISEALTLLSDVGDLRHEGLFLTYLATLDAQEGRLDAARTALGSAKVRLDSVRDPLLLTVVALRSMDLEVRAAAAGRAEAQALLDDVRAPRAERRARTEQSEEVRIAAELLSRTLGEGVRT